MSRKVPFVDIADQQEDDRIRTICIHATSHGKDYITGFFTDSDPGKAERYIKKLLERFPVLMVIDQTPGPVSGVVLVRVRQKTDLN